MKQQTGLKMAHLSNDADYNRYFHTLSQKFHFAIKDQENLLPDQKLCQEALKNGFGQAHSECDIVVNFKPLYQKNDDVLESKEIGSWISANYLLASTLLQWNAQVIEQHELRLAYCAKMEDLNDEKYTPSGQDYYRFAHFAATSLNPDRNARLLQNIEFAMETNLEDLNPVIYTPLHRPMTDDEVTAHYFLKNTMRFKELDVRKSVVGAYAESLKTVDTPQEKLLLISGMLEKKNEKPEIIAIVKDFYNEAIVSTQRLNRQELSYYPRPRRYWIETIETV